jgi:DNA-binding MarR family transcriptional regulator
MTKQHDERDKSPHEDARFAYAGLHRVIHERSRLSILTSLASHPDGLVFNDLKSLCSLTDGNLSRQLQVLSEAGLVEVWKSQRRKRPQTLARLTAQGRRRFGEYLNVLESVLADAATVDAGTSQLGAARVQPG